MARWIARLVAVLAAVLCAGGTATTTASAAVFTYDVSTHTRVGTQHVEADDGGHVQLSDHRDQPASPRVEARGTSTIPAHSFIATKAGPGTDLVPYDPKLTSRQIAGQNTPGSTGYATTPGGRTLSVHGAERVYQGGPGRAPVDPSLVNDILDQGTKVAYDPVRQTVKVSAPSVCGKCYVVVDSATGKHVVTVMVPGK